MSNILGLSSIFEEIKGDFSSLWTYKQNGSTVEIVTPYMNLQGDAIVVYLTKRGSHYVVSDGGDIGSIAKTEGVDLMNLKSLHYGELVEHYGILECEYNNDTFCYKSTDDIKMLSSLIYDIVHFNHALVDEIYLRNMFPDGKERERYFGTKVNELLRKKVAIWKDEKPKYELFQMKELKSLQFNSFVREIGTQNIWTSMAIYGRDLHSLRNSVQRAQFGFNYVMKNRLDNVIMAAVVDTIPKYVYSRKDAKVYIEEIGLWPQTYKSDNYTIDEFTSIPSAEDLFHRKAA